MRFDRGECQTYAKQGIGDATDCWKPVFINLLFTDLLVDWLELLFLTSEVRKMKEATSETWPSSFGTDVNIGSEVSPSNHEGFLETERKTKKSQIEREALVFLPSLLIVMMDHIWDTRTGITPFLLAPLAEFASFYWFVFVRLSFSNGTHAWTTEIFATILTFILLVARTDETFLRLVKDLVSLPINLFSRGVQESCMLYPQLAEACAG
jgi:hypothetical protein